MQGVINDRWNVQEVAKASDVGDAVAVGKQPYGQKIRTARKLTVISIGMVSPRVVRYVFLRRSMAPIANHRANGGAHGVDTYPGLDQRDGGPGAAAAE